MIKITIIDKDGIKSEVYAKDEQERKFYLKYLKKSNPNARSIQ